VSSRELDSVPETGPDWRAVDVGGATLTWVIDHSPGLVMVGGRAGGRPFLAHVDHEGEVDQISVPDSLAPHGDARTARWGDEGLIGVCGQTGLWCQHGSDGETTVPAVPRDETGVAPSRLWVTSGDGQLRVVAAYPRPQGWEIRILDPELTLLPTQRSLVVGGELETVHVAAFAGRVCVVGADDRSERLGLWWSRSYAEPERVHETPDPEWRPVAWQRVPDRVAQGLDGDAGAFFAGSSDEEALVWDIEGEVRWAGEVALDPSSPTVLLAEAPPGEPTPSVAFQTPAGGVLAHGSAAFTLPPGRLEGVVLNRGFDLTRCFAIVDGGLCVFEVPD
jgi:hypothetical protein